MKYTLRIPCGVFFTRPFSWILRKSNLTMILLCGFVLILILGIAPSPGYAAPPLDPITAFGEACAVAQDGNNYCYDLEITFVVVGGEVNALGLGEMEITQNGVTFLIVTDLIFEGTFEGGDGGILTGAWAGTSTMNLPEGETIGTSADGTWEGNLYADGQGFGTWQGGAIAQNGTWYVTYSSADFIAGLPTQESLPTPTEEEAPTVIPRETETSPQPTATSAVSAVLPGGISTGDSPENGGDLDEPLVTDAEQAATDPLGPITGGALGTLVGGLMAYLASRGAEAAALLQNAGAQSLDELAKRIQSGELDSGEEENLAEFRKHALDLTKIVTESGLMKNSGKKLAESPSISLDLRQYAQLPINMIPSIGDSLTALNLFDGWSQIKGIPNPNLKHLGSLNLVKGIYDRYQLLSEKRGDEPFWYKASTGLEAATLETLKFFATKNPFIGTLDNAAGTALGRNPSDSLCDATSNFLDTKLYDEYYMASAFRGGKYGLQSRAKHKDFLINEARKEIKELRAQYDRGEISAESYTKQAKPLVRGWRVYYTETAAKDTDAINKFWSN